MLSALLAIVIVTPARDSDRPAVVPSGRQVCQDTVAPPMAAIRFTSAGARAASTPALPHLTFVPTGPCVDARSLWPDPAKPVSHLGTGQGSPRVMAFEYSDGYRLRAKIHKVASFVTLPLFGAEAYLGQRLFNNVAQAGTSMRKLHRDVAEAIGGLFAVNSVTGVWNMISARKDPNGLVLRTIHSVLMLVADGGFVATAFTRPKLSSEIYDQKKNQHLTIAYASISVATVGYLVMLFWK